MKFCISTAGIKRVTISNSNAGGVVKGSPPTTTGTVATGNRRISSRTILSVALVLVIGCSFLFVRIAVLVLESATLCSSSLECVRWGFLGGSDTSLRLREELTRALLEANEGDGKDEGPLPLESFNELVKDISTNTHDVKAFAFKTRAMLLKMERNVRSARRLESIYWHLASHGVPKSLHCLCLKLAEEYAVNSMARSRLPSPEYVSRLADPNFHHIVLLTDNVLAASVVISSAIQNSVTPEKLVFHIVTDKKTYTAMHAWFAINSLRSAVVEVKGLHQFDWSEDVNAGVKEMLEIHRQIWRHYYRNLKEDFKQNGDTERNIEALSPSSLSLMNHLRIYIPELFPELNKIVFLDDDIVVQHDISSLWELDLNEKVVGAVVNSWCGENCCPGRKYSDYLNFSHPVISSNFDRDRCAWLSGMNVFNLDQWRKTNITYTYHHWLKVSRNSGLTLWRPGALAPTLIAFEGQLLSLDPSWHVAGLGSRSPEVHGGIMNTAAILHFSGPAKPWLEIGFPEVRRIWSRYVNISDKFIRKCRIIG